MGKDVGVENFDRQHHEPERHLQLRPAHQMGDAGGQAKARIPAQVGVPLPEIETVADLVMSIVATELSAFAAGPHHLELSRPGFQLVRRHDVGPVPVPMRPMRRGRAF